MTKGKMLAADDARCNCKHYGNFLYGIYFSMPLSRIEEALNIEKFKCDKCSAIAIIRDGKLA